MIGSLSDLGGSGGTVRDGDTVGATLTTGGDDSSTTFSGLIEDGDHELSLVKAGTGNLAGPDGICQRRFVMDPTARSIDEIRGWLHQCELRGAEQAKRFLGARAMDGDVVRPPQQVW